MQLFQKKPSANAQKIIDFIGCPCEYFPAGSSEKAILNAYDEAFARSGLDGCVPVIVIVSDTLAEWFEDTRSELGGQSVEEWRRELLSQPLPDVEEWLGDVLSELGFSRDCDYMGEITGGAKYDRLDVITDYSGKTQECILVKIPVKEPWQVFAYVPFGGWNECPPPELMMAIAKRWYERYRAVPALISHDTLEMSAVPLKDVETALAAAQELFAFCPDSVFQGVGFVGALAHTLMQSTVWFFWWD